MKIKLIALALLACTAFRSTPAPAQVGSQLRKFDGWNSASSYVQQAAYYQVPGTPNAGYPALDSILSQPVAGQASAAGQSLPALPQNFPNAPTSSPLQANGPIPSSMPQYTGAAPPASANPNRLSDAQRPTAPPPMPTRQTAANQPPLLPPQTGQGNYSQAVGVSNSNLASLTAGVQPSNPPRAVGQTIGYQQQANGSNQEGNSWRQINTPAATSGGRLDPSQITSGPPFVMPARGRYPTSTYNHAFFQTAAFQRQQTVGGLVATTMAPPNSLLASNQSAGNQLVSGQLASAQLPGQTAGPTTIQTAPQLATGIYPTSYQCEPVTVPQTAFVPSTITPNAAPTIYSSNNAGWRPLLSLGQEKFNVQLGRGILGQPVAYVPKQPVRNFFRYIFP